MGRERSLTQREVDVSYLGISDAADLSRDWSGCTEEYMSSNEIRRGRVQQRRDVGWGHAGSPSELKGTPDGGEWWLRSDRKSEPGPRSHLMSRALGLGVGSQDPAVLGPLDVNLVERGAVVAPEQRDGDVD